ncbi:hypothetical protein C8R43DRAFT_1007654 [Mycena crocata]|nr:hypothetical protein C8R43DRAFT_1007654 [Mycena crocata]
MTCTVLPPYSRCPPIPTYSPEPAPDEQRVEHTPRARTHPTWNYTKTYRHDAIVLTEQVATSRVPVYGRNASITGFITVGCREMVCEVVLKVNGQMTATIAEGGSLKTSQTTKLVSDCYTLWSSQTPHTSHCPGTIPFSVLLPTEFSDSNGVSHALPPTYDVPLIAAPGISLKSSYTLSVTITRGRRFKFLSKSKTTIPIPFCYSPRIRPCRPIQPSSDFYSDVKIMPEEWRQTISHMKPRPRLCAQPVDLQLFLPITDTFGLEDIIPLHIQLTGPVASIRQFLPQCTNLSRPGTIVATLLRQIVVEINGRQATRNIVIGTAKLCSCPPGAAADDHEASLDWGGEVQITADAMVGMFDAGSVRIQDSIVIELRPSNPETSEFCTLHYSHPIKLVKDLRQNSSSNPRHRVEP